MRRGALLNVAQLSGMVPTSVGGGENADGNWSLMAGFCGPGSVMLLGFVALTAPWGGSSGLPKDAVAFSGAAAAVAAAVITPAATVVANASRLDIILATPRGLDDGTCARFQSFADAEVPERALL
jgi:hypothetical protein